MGAAEFCAFEYQVTMQYFDTGVKKPIKSNCTESSLSEKGLEECELQRMYSSL